MAALLRASCRRTLHTTARRSAVTNLQMPAMSPTMTEGGIASWKKQEGEAFTAGDVLLEIETDKATIDVEAQEDGVMGKILAPDGTKSIPVGKVIALLAEEGDDISNLSAPVDDSTPAPKATPTKAQAPPPTPTPTPPQPTHAHGPAPTHDRPLFPSVHRLVVENGITNLDKIKGTGVRGMITKGDVLAFLGQASGPLGTFKPGPSPIEEALKARGASSAAPLVKEAPAAPLDGPAIRRLIVSNMLSVSQKALAPRPNYETADFNSVLADYLPPVPKLSKPAATTDSPKSPAKQSSFLDGLF